MRYSHSHSRSFHVFVFQDMPTVHCQCDMEAHSRTKMQPSSNPAPSLLQLPEATLFAILRNVDAQTLVNLERTSSFFTRKDPISRLRLTEYIAREQMLDRCNGDLDCASRFREANWKERLHLEATAGCGFDRPWCEAAGFAFTAPDSTSATGAAVPPTVRLTGMGPKLLLSAKSTADQPILRWRLRVRGNTAVEFGAIPATLLPSHTALHKCAAVPDAPNKRCVGFCSQITAGSLLPLKAPVMRGTVLDVVARRGRLQVLLQYPEDAKEISWHNGQPVQRPYRGPSQLRFEQDFSPDHDVRLAVTSWAKGAFEVLHTGSNAAEEVAFNGLSLDMEPEAVPAAARVAAAAASAGVPAAAAARGLVKPAAAVLPLPMAVSHQHHQVETPLQSGTPDDHHHHSTLRASSSFSSLHSYSGEPAAPGLPELGRDVQQHDDAEALRRKSEDMPTAPHTEAATGEK